MEVLALIPARGGSKGIKRKNIIPINEKPLLVYSIEHALSSSVIDRVIVSTEDEEIRNIALKYGAEVPFYRPKELAEDLVPDTPVFKHALEFLDHNENYRPDIVVHLRPTAPYRKLEWIEDTVSLLSNNPGADSVCTISRVKEHPYRMFSITKNGFLDPIMSHEHYRPHIVDRHDLPDIYYYNCIIDVTKPQTVFRKDCTVGDIIIPYVIDENEVADIDTSADLKRAETLLRNSV